MQYINELACKVHAAENPGYITGQYYERQDKVFIARLPNSRLILKNPAKQNSPAPILT